MAIPGTVAIARAGDGDMATLAPPGGQPPTSSALGAIAVARPRARGLADAVALGLTAAEAA
jgi:hypothetical protein